jgi:hypothetical protein
MRGISWLAAKPVTFSRRTLLRGVSNLHSSQVRKRGKIGLNQSYTPFSHSHPIFFICLSSKLSIQRKLLLGRHIVPVTQYITTCLSNIIEAGWTKKPNKSPYYSQTNYACHLQPLQKKEKEISHKLCSILFFFLNWVSCNDMSKSVDISFQKYNLPFHTYE